MTTVFQTEGWTATDLWDCTASELKSLAGSMGYPLPQNATKAEMVALMTGEVIPRRDPAHDMLREASQLASWRRGVPPPHACLTADDKLWVQRMWNPAA